MSPTDTARRRPRRRGAVLALASAAVLAAAGGLAWQSPGSAPDDARPVWVERFDDPSLAAWEQVHRATPSRLGLVDAPGGDGGRAARFRAADGDVAPRTPTENPRAQLNSRLEFTAGQDVHVGWSTYFPAGFPRRIAPWFVFFQFHGEPYDGSPRIALGVKDGRVGLERDERYRFDRPWTGPLRTGGWTDYVLRVKWSANPRVGFVELWVDGRPQRFAGGRRRLGMATMKRSQSRVEVIPTNYRKRGSVPGTVTVFHDDIAVGPTYASVSR